MLKNLQVHTYTSVIHTSFSFGNNLPLKQDLSGNLSTDGWDRGVCVYNSLFGICIYPKSLTIEVNS